MFVGESSQGSQGRVTSNGIRDSRYYAQEHVFPISLCPSPARRNIRIPSGQPHSSGTTAAAFAMFAKTIFCALGVCALLLTSLGTSDARKLQAFSASCCSEGFQFDSPFLTISVQDGDVDIDSPIGSVSVSDNGVVVDSPLLKVNTTERVRVEVAGGNVMTLTTGENGFLELTIGKGGALVTVVIDESGHKAALPEGDEVVVDFSDPSGAIAVDVGEGGKIVDVKTEGSGKARVKAGKGGKVALVDVSGGDGEGDAGGSSEEDKGKKKNKNKKKKATDRKGDEVEEKEPVVSVEQGSDKGGYGDEDLRKDKKPKVRQTGGSEVDQEFRTESDSLAVVRVKGTKVISATVEEIA